MGGTTRNYKTFVRELNSRIDNLISVKQWELIGESVDWARYYLIFQNTFQACYEEERFDPKMIGTKKFLEIFRSYLGSLVLIFFHGDKNHDIIIDFIKSSKKEPKVRSPEKAQIRFEFLKGKISIDEDINTFYGLFKKSDHWKAFIGTKDILFEKQSFESFFSFMNQHQLVAITEILNSFKGFDKKIDIALFQELFEDKSIVGLLETATSRFKMNRGIGASSNNRAYANISNEQSAKELERVFGEEFGLTYSSKRL